MKRKLTFGLLLVLAAVAILVYSGDVPIALAQGETIDKWVIASGGGVSSGGNITIEDTLGQPIIGPPNGSSIGLHSGYWYLVYRPAGATFFYIFPLFFQSQ